MFYPSFLSPVYLALLVVKQKTIVRAPSLLNLAKTIPNFPSSHILSPKELVLVITIIIVSLNKTSLLHNSWKSLALKSEEK